MTNKHDIVSLEPRLLMAATLPAARALTINPYDIVSVADTFSAKGETDRFSFVAKASGQVTLDILSGTKRLTAAAAAYGPGNSLIAQASNAALSFNVIGGQTYTLTASALGTLMGAYTLKFTTVAAGDDAGNSIAAARTITLPANGNLSQSISISYANDSDFFSFVAMQTGKIDVHMVNISSLGAMTNVDPELVAYDAAGKVLVSNDNYVDSTAHIGFKVVSGQRYYVAAKSHTATTGEAALAFASRPDPAPASQITVAPGDVSTWTDAFTRYGEIDRFSFVAAATGQISLDIFSGGSRAKAMATIYNSSNSQLASSSSSTLKINVTAGATYYITAGALGAFTGAYSLNFVSTVTGDDFGNSFATAKSLALAANSLLSQELTLSYRGDTDVFTFVASQTGRAVIDMIGRERPTGVPAIDPSLTVYNASGQIVGQNDNYVRTDAHVSFNIVSGQRYYVRAQDAANGMGPALVTFTSTQNLTDTPATPAALAAQAVVTAVTTSQAGGLQLTVLGTSGTDSITVNQTAAGLVLTTPVGTQTLAGSFSSIVICGFGGDDTIRLTSNVTAMATIYGGAGNDTIYAAGRGVDKIAGEAGDDLLISLGGGIDQVYGGDGTDSFWCDSADALADVSQAEMQAMTVHQVTAFTGNVSREIAGQAIADPGSGGYAYKSFASKPLFTTGPKSTDVKQGNIADGGLLSSLAGLADGSPNVIRQMITALGDGTFAVRQFINGIASYVRVDADLPVTASGSPAFAQLSPEGELWVALTEKAFFMSGGRTSYGATTICSTLVYDLVMRSYGTFTGVGKTNTEIANTLKNALDAGKAVVAISGLNPGNSCMVKSVETTAGGIFLTVYNPWGADGRSAVKTGADGMIRMSIQDFTKMFLLVQMSSAL